MRSPELPPVSLVRIWPNIINEAVLLVARTERLAVETADLEEIIERVMDGQLFKWSISIKPYRPGDLGKISAESFCIRHAVFPIPEEVVDGFRQVIAVLQVEPAARFVKLCGGCFDDEHPAALPFDFLLDCL